jgi:formyl-CoA transferase
MVERHRLGDKELLLPGIVPKLSETPGETRWVGPRLGEHTDEVLGAAGYDAGEIAALRGRGVIA